MTQTQRFDRLRNLFAYCAAILGIVGYLAESWWITGAGLGFVLAYIGAQILRANAWIEEQKENDR